MELNQNQFKRIQILALQLYGNGKELDIYIKLSDNKFLKVSHRNEEADAVLVKYQKRGLEHVFLSEEDFTNFTSQVRLKLLEKIKQEEERDSTPDAPLEDGQIEIKSRNLSAATDVVKVLFASGNFSEEAKALSRTVTEETIKLVKRTNIFEKFKQFKKNCSLEYLNITLTCYVTSVMIDSFNWANDQIKSKVALAALVCDIHLSPEEFKILHEAQGNQELLSKKILHHPLETAQALANESKFFSSETLQIVEQHHELPNGKGFPRGIDYQRISPLTSVYIVANYFVERMFDQNYDPDDLEWNKEKLRELLVQIKNKFYNGNFRKASESLEKAFG